MAIAASSAASSAVSSFPAAALPVLLAFWHWLHRPVANEMPSPGVEHRVLPPRHPASATTVFGSRNRPAPVPRRWGGPVRPGAAQASRPLRAVRVFDGSAARGTGRMVISGRLADVCDEIDRLAALEAARG